jgi:hypothetical protein
MSMPEFRVTWACDIDAATAVEAARKAVEMIADPKSIAHCFHTRTKDQRDGRHVDLDQIDGKAI